MVRATTFSFVEQVWHGTRPALVCTLESPHNVCLHEFLILHPFHEKCNSTFEKNFTKNAVSEVGSQLPVQLSGQI